MMKLTLKALRNLFGLSQKQEAHFIHVSPWTIANYENGVHTPNAKTLVKISKLYGVQLNQITLRPSLTLPTAKKGEN